MEKVSKETNIAYVIISIVFVVFDFKMKYSYWNLIFIPINYVILLLSLRELTKQAEARRKTNTFKWDELTEDAKKDFSKNN